MPPAIMEVCSTFSKPTAIQSQCWPLVLSGHDVIGVAATGSGKTVAFGLPGLVHAQARGIAASGKPFMLVVAPTRELAIQIHKVLQVASDRCSPPLGSVCIFGGVDKKPQRTALRNGVGVVMYVSPRPSRLPKHGCFYATAHHPILQCHTRPTA